VVDQGDVGGEDQSGLSESLTALGQFVLSEQSLQESLQRVAELSVRAVYGADGAGVTWVVAGRPTTVTAAGTSCAASTRSSTASTRDRACPPSPPRRWCWSRDQVAADGAGQPPEFLAVLGRLGHRGSSRGRGAGRAMTTEPESARPLLSLSGYHLAAFQVVELSGDCDIATARALRDGLAQALDDPDRGLIVDMSRVSFCDGESAATILVAGSGRRLAVVGVSGVICLEAHT